MMDELDELDELCVFVFVLFVLFTGWAGWVNCLCLFVLSTVWAGWAGYVHMYTHRSICIRIPPALWATCGLEVPHLPHAPRHIARLPTYFMKFDSQVANNIDEIRQQQASVSMNCFGTGRWNWRSFDNSLGEFGEVSLKLHWNFTET